MLKRIAVLLVLLCVVTAANAQEPPARLRLLQLTYADSGATADVRIDDGLVFTSISWPFATEYLELLPGEHTVTTALTSSDETASARLALEAGRSYSVVAHGDYAAGVTFTLVDESDAPLSETGAAGIILNLTSEPITNLRVDERSVIDLIPPGSYDAFSLPVAPFTVAGQLGDLAYSEEFTPLSNAFLLGVVRTAPTGDLQVIYQRSSHLTVAEYLKAIPPGTQFSDLANALTAEAIDATLPDDGAYTVFLPTNAAIEQAGPLAAGAMLLAGHATGQSQPPTLLPNQATLPMLDGRTAQLAFSDTSSGYWEIDGAAILWEVHLANGVIYAIDGVLGAHKG
jgi:hypothetical protein